MACKAQSESGVDSLPGKHRGNRIRSWNLLCVMILHETPLGGFAWRYAKCFGFSYSN